MLNKNKSRKVPKAFTGFKGTELIDKIIDIDQSPIGRTPRSILLHTQVLLVQYVNGLLVYLSQKQEVIKLADIHLMLRVEDVKHVRVTV